MEGEEVGIDNKDELSGFIFMCNRMTKPECYRFRVFALPAGRKHIVERINRGTYLFLFDTDVKLLYGIYLATSTGMLNIEPFAFGGRFPAQVSFKIHYDCWPLQESHFKHAIKDNYQKHSNKFNPELNMTQVRSLLKMFRPLTVPSTVPRHPGLNGTHSDLMLPYPTTNRVFHQTSRSLFEDSILSRMSHTQAPRLSNNKDLNGHEKPTGRAYPVNNLMPNSVAAQSEFDAKLSLYTPSLPHPQYTHDNILNLQPDFHSSLMNKGSGHAQSLQDSQHAQLNILHSQPEFHSSMMTMGGSHTQFLQHSQHQHVLYPQPDLHPSMMTVGSTPSHDQSLQHSEQAHPNALDPQPEFHSSMMTNTGYTRSLQDPQQSILNPPSPGVHPQAVNVGSSHAQMPRDPHNTYQSTLNLQPSYYPSVTNVSGSYTQLFPDPQHSYQEAQNLQPQNAYQEAQNLQSQHAYQEAQNLQPQHAYQEAQNLHPAISSSVNTDHTNFVMQSHASSSLYYPYVPQQVISGTYAVQGSGPIQEVISSDQQAGIGSEYYQPSMQTDSD